MATIYDMVNLQTENAELRDRVMELEAIIEKQNVVLMNAGLLAMRKQIQACLAPDAGDDPCEQCGQPCDGSRCPADVRSSGS